MTMAEMLLRLDLLAHPSQLLLRLFFGGPCPLPLLHGNERRPAQDHRTDFV